MENSTARDSLTYPRAARLSGARCFARVFEKGKRSADRFFTVIFRPSDGGTARLGFAIARKRVPTAVARNRLKRVVRESFRQSRRDLPAVDLVVMASSGAATSEAAVLRQSLDRHWQKIRQQCARMHGAEGSD